MASLRKDGEGVISKLDNTRRGSSKHYYQGGYDYEFVNGLERRHECPICLLCQRDPYQTSCGHRFCYTCILTWLSEGKTCPDDNSSLGEGDIFPDTIAHREILQLLVRCPLAKVNGCKVVASLAEIENHERLCSTSKASTLDSCTDRTLSSPEAITMEASPPTGKLNQDKKESVTCPSCGELLEEEDAVDFKARKHNLICPHVKVACPFASAGCEDDISRTDLSDHIQHSTVRHVQLLWERLLKLQQLQSIQDDVCSSHNRKREESESSDRNETRSLHEGMGCCDPSNVSSPFSHRDNVLRMSGSNLHSTQRLIKDLYHRVVALEQKSRHLEIVNQTLRGRIRQLRLMDTTDKEAERWDVLGRTCNGIFLWKIVKFSELLEQMRHNHSFVIYSRGFYTTPFGYKMCLRCNIRIIDGEEHLGLFVHMMEGDFDDALSWPFVGKIQLKLINRDVNRMRQSGVGDFCEIMGTPVSRKSSAFERPGGGTECGRNPVGYGILEFVRVNSLYTCGFVGPPERKAEDKLLVKARVICTEEDA